MSVTTPSTGQKISDFSAGNVDANSYFIQANSGSTSKVTATQIGQYSNLNLLFSGTGGLDTTNKTIVGAINEVNRKDLGDIDDVNLSSPANGDILVYDGTLEKWKNGDNSAYKIAYNNAIVGAFTGTTVQTALDNIGSCLVTATTTSTKNATIRTKSGTAYGMFLILGFIQMIGSKMIAIQTGSTGIISCIDVLTGQTFSNQNITFSFADNALTIETTGSGTSTFTIIKG